MTDDAFRALLDAAPKNPVIDKTLMTARAKLGMYAKVAVSYSGGSDSDLMIDLIELLKPEGFGVIKYVFFDTGLEWGATLRHIAETEEKYGVEIERRKARMPIPAACKKHGIPCFDKFTSGLFATYQRHGFDFNAEGRGIEHLALRKKWMLGGNGQHVVKPSRKEFVSQNPPTFRISDKCCNYAKKLPAKDFYKEFSPDLDIQGVRKSEGGPRSSAYKSCFTQNDDGMDSYRPLFFWTDADKQAYKEWRGLRYSDCYEVWGFKRTGCVGCPCSARAVKDLETARQYEPGKVAAAYAIFEESYRYREAYNHFLATGGHRP